MVWAAVRVMKSVLLGPLSAEKAKVEIVTPGADPSVVTALTVLKKLTVVDVEVITALPLPAISTIAFALTSTL